ncbi:MAG: hypothetical protein NZ957_01335 [Thaumarchaeota archaeon]|nr:hypothetical protein [Candidatus Calditenuaceae archaeon]MDW8041707.1 hypothetical protein [Nitrososphaerota archaeon]
MNFKRVLRQDISLVVFVALLTSTAYSTGGLLSLVLSLILIGVLAAFISMVKGVDVLIIYLTFSLFLVAIAQIASGWAGIAIILTLGVFLAIRGLVNLPINRNNMIKLGVIVAILSAIYALVPHPFGLIGFGVASAVLLGLLAWSGVISLYVVYLLITKPKMGLSVLVSRIRSSWEMGMQRVAEEAAARDVEMSRSVEEARFPQEETMPQEPAMRVTTPGQPQPAQQLSVEVMRYLNFLRSLEENYKTGKINEAVYNRLRNEYVNRLMELGYQVEGSSR